MTAGRNHVGRVPSRGAGSRGVHDDAKVAASGDAAYNPTRPTAVGRVPSRGARPEGAKAGWRKARLPQVTALNSRTKPASDDDLVSFVPNHIWCGQEPNVGYAFSSIPAKPLAQATLKCGGFLFPRFGGE